MDNNLKTQEEYEKEMLELNQEFSDFIHAKGVKAKFKLAFGNMGDSSHKQHEIDKENFKKVKEESIENNKEFYELLHTKGFNAKFKLIIENIKKGAKDAPNQTAHNIAKVKAQTQANIANSVKVPSHVTKQNTGVEVFDAKTLEVEFNNFLKSKGLDSKYTVNITEE